MEWVYGIGCHSELLRKTIRTRESGYDLHIRTLPTKPLNLFRTAEPLSLFRTTKPLNLFRVAKPLN